MNVRSKRTHWHCRKKTVVQTVVGFVLQMTGRKGRVVSTDDGGVQYESRSESDVPLELLNLTEKSRFMDGEKVEM